MSPNVATAPQRAPRHVAPGPARREPGDGQPRRHLRSVEPSTQVATRGRPRVHIVLGVGVAGLFAVLFAVAVLQTVLVQGQIHLDGLQADVAEAEVEVQVLRAQVGQLESPDRVISEATSAGMVPAEAVRSIVPPAESGTAAP